MVNSMSLPSQLFDAAQQWLFEAVVQPALFALGLANVLEDAYVATGWLLVGLLQLLVMLALIGPLAARYGEARVIVIGLCLLALSMLLQPIIRLPISGVLLMGLLMTGHSLAFPSAGALLSRNTPPERQGSTMGLLMASNAVGRIIAPPVFGLIYDRIGHDAPWFAGAVMIALVALIGLQAVRISAARAAAAAEAAAV